MTHPRFAFFDVDETLINAKSMFSFQSFYHRRRWGRLGSQIADWRSRGQLERLIIQGADRSQVNAAFFAEFRGSRPEEVQVAAISWFEHIRTSADFFIEPVLDALRKHQLDGIKPVFVSGSSLEILQPLADQLQVHHILANRLEVDAGRYTGRLLPPQTIGTGKREAVNSFLLDQGANPSCCFAYGDHLSDLPFLETVGHPTVIARNNDLIAIARDRGWPIILTQPSILGVFP